MYSSDACSGEATSFIYLFRYYRPVLSDSSSDTDNVQGAISLFLVKTPHRDFSHAHMSALPGDVTSLATECHALKVARLDSPCIGSFRIRIISSITLVVYSINMTLTLVAARNQLNCMRVILNNVTGSPSPTVIQCANTVTGFFLLQ